MLKNEPQILPVHLQCDKCISKVKITVHRTLVRKVFAAVLRVNGRPNSMVTAVL